MTTKPNVKAGGHRPRRESTREIGVQDRGRGSTKPVDTTNTLDGKILEGRYRLDQVVSTGGMGVVYQASQVHVGRQVAVKIVRPNVNDPRGDLARRFANEIDVIGRLNHPNIVSLLDTGRDINGLHFLVMEFVEGDTLRDLLKDSRLTLAEIIEVYIQTCNALVEAHSHDVIHRDLKFDNIMVRRLADKRLHVTILDFGVAKQLSRSDTLTRSGEVPGTPGIIAPELVDGKPPSPQSDLYSLGVLLFTSLTGKAPFKGANELELMRAHKTEQLPNLRHLVDDRVPEALIEVTCELLEKEPHLRPETAAAVRDRLERIERDLSARHPDARPYIPQRGGGLRSLDDIDDDVDRSQQFLEISRDRDDDRPRETELAPTTVVGVLIAVLMLLAIVLLYLMYQRVIVG
jgi:serine/threonine protein kinase